MNPVGPDHSNCSQDLRALDANHSDRPHLDGVRLCITRQDQLIYVDFQMILDPVVTILDYYRSNRYLNLLVSEKCESSQSSQIRLQADRNQSDRHH